VTCYILRWFIRSQTVTHPYATVTDSPPNMVCVTALPCKTLTLHVFSLPVSCTRLLPLIITNTKKICTLDTTHVKKRHSTELRHIIEMLSMVIKDLRDIAGFLLMIPPLFCTIWGEGFPLNQIRSSTLRPIRVKTLS